MTDWTDIIREGIDVLRGIEEAWSTDEHHDVPLELILRAREVLWRVGDA